MAAFYVPITELCHFLLRLRWWRLALAGVAFVASASAAAAQAKQFVSPGPAYETRKRQTNENVVAILGGVGTQSSWSTLVQDMQLAFDETTKKDGLRILALQGRGGLQNAFDVLMLRGVDMAVLDQSHVQSAREKDPQLFANIGQRLQYIAKIANSDLQIIAGPGIKTIMDLDGKKVNCMIKASSVEVTCAAVFSILGIKVEFTHLDQDQATIKLRNGEIAAFARYGPTPNPAFGSFKSSEGYHFLPIDAASASPEAFAALSKAFTPTLIKSEFYPTLVQPDAPVPTVAGNLILVTYAWPVGSERYERVSKFVRTMFDNIEKLKEPSRHPAWKEINLAYDLPGWTRFKAARDWLNQRTQKHP